MTTAMRGNARQFTLLVLILGAAAAQAQDEAKRYRTGQIKVGDRIEIPWGAPGNWVPCTVIGARPMPGDAAKIDAYQLRCDQGYPSGTIADSDHVRPAAVGAVHAPGWNVTDAAQVGPKGANKYGARNPHACAPVRGGAITQAMATQAFICGAEGVRGQDLYLVENVRLQLGGPTHYDPRTHTGFSGMDTRIPPYAIRGSYSQFQCGQQDADPKSRFYNYNVNCSRYDNRNASGYCYLTTFGKWKCSMYDVMMAQDDKHHRLAPPR